GLSYLPTSHTLSWTLGSLIVCLTFAFNCAIGPVCDSPVSEIALTQLRVKTVVIARIMYNNWRGRTALVFAGVIVICFVWCYFRLPKPKGLAYLEVNILFQYEAGTKKFKIFQANLAERGYFRITSSSLPIVDWRRNS
ncbi:uncharacterized protein N7458_012685, partial [Penicillium daleae]